MAKLHNRSIHEGIGLSCEKCKYIGKNLAGLLVRSHAEPPRYDYRFKLTPVVPLLGRLIS